VADVVVSSFALHQSALQVKQRILEDMFAVGKPSARVCIADYGLHRSLLMQILFRQVRMFDGFEKTKTNKDGMALALLGEARFQTVAVTRVIQTPTGSISIYQGRKPAIQRSP